MAEPANNAPPTIAVYPLLPEPEMLENGSIDLLLAQIKSQLTTAASSTDEFVVLDRSDLRGRTLSPERESLATRSAADYVLTGSLIQRNNEPAMRLQLSHVRSNRLVALKTFMLDDQLGVPQSDVIGFLRFAAKRDNRYSDDDIDFRLSVAGVFPVEGSNYRLPEVSRISEAVTEELLGKDRFALISGQQAYALYLESYRLPDRTGIKRADVILHARLLNGGSSTEGLDLVLFLERVDGLRKVIALRALTQEQMVQRIVEAVNNQLKVLPHVSSTIENDAQDLVNQAWSEIYKKGRPLLNLFPFEITDKNKSRLHSFKALIDEALALNPSNHEAIAGKALYAGLNQEYALEYSHLQSLLWSPRPEAFDMGVQILRNKLNMGSSYYFKGNAAGLAEYPIEDDAVQDLIKLDWLFAKEKGYRLWWNFRTHLPPITSKDDRLWEYVLGIRNPDLDSLARFKVLPGPMSIVQASRPDDVPTGIDHRQSVYYALANSIAPLSLRIGLNGFYSAPVDLIIHSDDAKGLQLADMYLFQRLAGMAALSNTPAIEPDLLYAATLCLYEQSMCSISQQLYQSILDRSKNFRQVTVSQARNPGRATLYADGLIAMARAKLSATKLPGVSTQGSEVTAAEPERVVGSFQLDKSELDKLRVIPGATTPCDNCAGLSSLRDVYASPDGRWLANSRPYFDVSGLYSANPALKKWMFDNGYLSVAGTKSVRKLPRVVVKRGLRHDFPELNERQINDVIAAYNTSEYKVKDSGHVEVHLDTDLNSMNIHSPDLRKEAKFGQQVALSNEKAIICDQWHEGYQFSLYPNAWEVDRKANLFCDGSHLAIVDEWIVKANGGRITFYTDDSDGYNQNASREIEEDFNTLKVGASVEDVKAHDNLLVVKARHRYDYFLLVYQLRSGYWQPITLLKLLNFTNDFEVFNNQIFQLNHNDVLVYGFDGTRLNLKHRFPVAPADNINPPVHLLLVHDTEGDKLVVDVNRELLQIWLD